MFNIFLVQASFYQNLLSFLNKLFNKVTLKKKRSKNWIPDYEYKVDELKPELEYLLKKENEFRIRLRETLNCLCGYIKKIW